MGADFESLLQKKLIVVTGKGGSGKSVLSLALAHRLSAERRRVWLVELGRKSDDAFSRLSDLLNVRALGHELREVKLPGSMQKVQAAILDPTESLAEYVNLKLPSAGLAGLLLKNRITASFLEVVPGLPDLVALGKLWHALTSGGSGGPDVVVLDAPASGHAVSLLRAPANFERITRFGPIHKDARQMREFLADPTATALALTTLPEEMSLQETLELQRALKGFPEPHLFVNRCFPELPKLDEEKESIVYRAYAYARRRGAREREAVRALGKAAVVRVPFFFPEPGADPLYLRIAGALPA